LERTADDGCRVRGVARPNLSARSGLLVRREFGVRRDTPAQPAGLVQGCCKLRAESSTFIDRGFEAGGNRMSFRLVDRSSDGGSVHECGLVRAARRPRRQRDLIAAVRE